MKKISILFVIFASFAACKGAMEATGKPNTEAELITGEFLFWNNAAVLKTDTELYGIVIDEKMRELDSQCKPLQNDEFDMMIVTIKGIIKKNPQPESWEEIVQIKEIISVSKPQNKEDSNSIIKNK